MPRSRRWRQRWWRKWVGAPAACCAARADCAANRVDVSRASWSMVRSARLIAHDAGRGLKPLAPRRGAGASHVAFGRLGFRRGLAEAAETMQDGIGRALARCPGAADRAPPRLMDGFAGKPNPILRRLHEHAPRVLKARCRRRK